MKGVILAAGYGSRFLPATKTIPKEMFPLVDTPAIQLIVEEFAAAGIHELLVVTSRRKKPLEDFFDRELELEGAFAGAEHGSKRERIAAPELEVFFVRQKHMSGTGDALLLAEAFVGHSPFVVAYPDDILLGGPPLAAQLMDTYEGTGKTVLAAQELAEGDVSRFGVVDTAPLKNGEELARAMVEKPEPGDEPSRLVAYGRYLYTAEIFDALRETRSSSGTGEFTQTEALNLLAGRERVAVCRFKGQLLDVGTPQGYLEATVEYGLTRQDFREPLLDYLRRVVAREGKG